MKRQLAAILYADAAGYSRLTGQNEERTHQQLNTGLNLLTEKIAASFRFMKSWSSVGASNPNDWVALAYEQAKQLDEDSESSRSKY